MSPTTEDLEPLEGLRRHKLLPPQIRAAIPSLDSTDGFSFNNRLLVVKFFCPYSEWRWYAVEFDGSDIFFGYVKGFCNEWGYFSFHELSNTTLGGGVPAVERDLLFEPVLFRDLIDGIHLQPRAVSVVADIVKTLTVPHATGAPTATVVAPKIEPSIDNDKSQ